MVKPLPQVHGASAIDSSQSKLWPLPRDGSTTEMVILLPWVGDSHSSALLEVEAGSSCCAKGTGEAVGPASAAWPLHSRLVRWGCRGESRSLQLSDAKPLLTPPEVLCEVSEGILSDEMVF